MNLKFIYLLILIYFVIACESTGSKPVIVSSSYPITLILKELVGTKAIIETLVPPGASPHTYTPNPSDYKKADRSTAFFFVSQNYDGWTSNINAKNKIEIFNLLPKENRLKFFAGDFCEHNNHKHESENNDNYDSHFWTDPITVKNILPFIVDTLSKIDPENAATYRTNADLFIKRLDLLDKQVFDLMKNLRGKSIFLYHPSMNYFINRYGLVYEGTIEEIPGKESSAKFLSQLISRIKETGTKAIFSEPQLPDKPAKLIQSETGIGLYIIDPIGGTNNIHSYSDLILYNARTIKKALE